MTTDRTITVRGSNVRPLARRRRWFGPPWVWCAIAFGACRTNVPEEVFYDGTPTAGVPSVNAGGAPGSGGSAPTAGAPATGGSLADGGSSSEPASGGDPNTSGGAGGSEEGPSTAGAAGTGIVEEPEPEVECGEAPIVEGPFSRSALRGAAVDCALHRFCRFEGAVTLLDHRLGKHTTAPSAESLTRVREAWLRAMAEWSVIELFQFGPLASNTMTAGKDLYRGQGLRESIYAWPSTVRCRVEDQVIGRGYAENMGGVLISGRGLYALEYLLFYPGADTACKSGTTAEAWSVLDPQVLAERKQQYASALGSDILERARGLRAAFDAKGGNFKQAFLDAAGYPSEQEAMNVLGWALTYVERELKDWKLGVPIDLTGVHPVKEAESPHAFAGTENVRNNLRGFRALFQGCGPNGEGLGFDDWLIEAGHGELADDIVAAWQNAQAAADAFGPLHTASKADVQALYATVKVLTDHLKTELFGAGSPLNLKLPGGLEGDTD